MQTKLRTEDSLELVKELYSFEVLDVTNKDLVAQTASVLADTFIGVEVGSSFIIEPMMKQSKMPKESFEAYIIEVLEQVGLQGLTVIARDKKSGEVVGAIVSEYWTPGYETVLLEGDLAPMNIVNLTTDKLITEFMDSLVDKGGAVEPEKLVHLFLIGVRLEFNKKYVGMVLAEVLEQAAKEKDADLIFSFVSNFRSQGLFKDYLGYSLAEKANGEPIVYPYAQDEFFKEIPEHIAIEGQIVVKELQQ